MGVIMITTKDLTMEYRSFGGGGLVAVDHINLEVENKDIFGFLGPNGAGKTTTIHMLTTVLDPTFGTAEVAGYDIIKDPLRAKAKMGIMPELPMFYDWMKAEDQLSFYAEFYGYSSSECRKRAKELVELVGLGKFGRSKIKTFSHGMRKGRARPHGREIIPGNDQGTQQGRHNNISIIALTLGGPAGVQPCRHHQPRKDHSGG